MPGTALHKPPERPCLSPSQAREVGHCHSIPDSQSAKLRDRNVKPQTRSPLQPRLEMGWAPDPLSSLPAPSCSRCSLALSREGPCLCSSPSSAPGPGRASPAVAPSLYQGKAAPLSKPRSGPLPQDTSPNAPAARGSDAYGSSGYHLPSELPSLCCRCFLLARRGLVCEMGRTAGSASPGCCVGSVS